VSLKLTTSPIELPVLTRISYFMTSGVPPVSPQCFSQIGSRTARGFHRRGSAGAGSEPERATPLAARVPSGARQRFSGPRQQRWAEGRIAELERKIGQQALEIDFLKGCFPRVMELSVVSFDRFYYSGGW
jgi:hypothetical protein